MSKQVGLSLCLEQIPEGNLMLPGINVTAEKCTCLGLSFNTASVKLAMERILAAINSVQA